MNDAHRALMNLVLLAHAEIRALRDVIALMLPADDPAAPVNASNWLVLEAECRRKHLEALNLPLDRFEGLVSEAMIAQASGALPEVANVEAAALPSDAREPETL